MRVWEVSEQRTAWISQSHIKLGVAGAGPQKFFRGLNKEASQLYSIVRKNSRTMIPNTPVEWNDTTNTAEARLSALLTSAVTHEIMQTAVGISEGFGEIKSFFSRTTVPHCVITQ